MRQATLVVQEICVVERAVGLAEVLRARLPDRQEPFGKRAYGKALEALLDSTCHRRRHALAGAGGEFLGEAVRLRVLNIEAHNGSFLVLTRLHSTIKDGGGACGLASIRCLRQLLGVTVARYSA
uniref:Uncharacterized protein n=1 Tax=mine drainage metagenome TaxID=410659 RepID=E6Q6S6_9ZZZZ